VVDLNDTDQRGRFVSHFLAASSLIEPVTNGKNVVVFSFSKISRLHISWDFAIVIYAAKFTNVSYTEAY